MSDLSKYEFYRNENGVLYCADCLTILPMLPKVNLIITSPPYDNLRDYNGYLFNFEGIAKELFEVTVSGGCLVWVVGDATINGSETLSAFKQALYFKELGLNVHDTMIYAKNGPAYPATNKYYQIFEYMFVFSKGSPKTFNPLKDRPNRWAYQKWSNKRTRRNKEGVLKDGGWSPNQGGKFGVRFNIWEYNVGHGYSSSDKDAYEHPAIFPERLANDHIFSWSNQGDTVLDPLCGSGTVLKMAERLDRKWIGVEISEAYCQIAVKRIERERQQLKLFR